MNPELESWLQSALEGDTGALSRLLEAFRPRLVRMVATRIDPRLSARLDPSDVVQEALATAGKRFGEVYPAVGTPFYVWLRGLAWERLVQLHRFHVRAASRSVLRERPWGLTLPDASTDRLADRLSAGGSSPSSQFRRRERSDRIKALLNQLKPSDREVLALHYLEELTLSEVAHVLGLREGTVRMRHLRALERVRALINESE